MKIEQPKALRGRVELPGDKSISHRAALFLAISKGEARIDNFAESEDCGSTLRVLRELGASIESRDSGVFVKGKGKTGLLKPAAALDCGNSGTTVRLLSGILAGHPFESTLTGDESLQKRPMKRIIEPLTSMGAKISANEQRLPLKISGTPGLRSIEYSLAVASAQVKSCILLAGLNAAGKTFVKSPSAKSKEPSSRDHTERMLKFLGADIEESFEKTPAGFVHRVSIDGASQLTARDINVPGDISAAAFFMVAAAGLENSIVELKNVGLNPTRAAVVDVLKQFGADISISGRNEAGGETRGDIVVRGKSGFAVHAQSNIIRGDVIANLIDEIPILAVFATRLNGGLEFRDAAELRVKESDRIAAVVENLKRMNAEVEEFSDGFRVGRSNLKGARVDSFGDHRIAMAFAVAALFAEGATEISDSACAAVSFPGFFDQLSKIST